jgi:uncharacterized protein (TIGR03435 family)
MMATLARATLLLSEFPFSVLVKGTVLLAAALFAVRGMHRAPASTRHFVLASAFLLLLALPAAELVVPALSLTIGQSGADVRAVLPITIVAPADAQPVVATSTASSIPGSPSTSSTYSTWSLLIAAWAAGVVVFLIPVLLTPWRARQLRRTGRPWGEGFEILRTVASDIVPRSVRLLVHQDVSAPQTCGVMHPAIVLPTDATTWSEAEIRSALTHELEHIRRADWPVHVASRAVCALYWFHPLAWMAWAKLRLESEQACDDAVLNVAEGTAYAQQLLTLARRRVRRSLVPALSMAGRSDLTARIAAVLDASRARGPLRLARALAIVAISGLLLVTIASLRAEQAPPPAQSAATNAAAFEVISIKQNRAPVVDKDDSSIALMPGGRLVTTNYPLRLIILLAFALQPQQLIGTPDWIDAARYDISAKAEGTLSMTASGPPGSAQLAIQRLLRDRFHLAVHTETRELPIFALTLARPDRRFGPRMKAGSVDCEAILKAMMQSAGGGAPPVEMPQRPDGSSACGSSQRFGRVITGGTTMAAFAQQISRINSRIIHDRTGLQGTFDIDLEFTPDATIYPNGTPPPGAPLSPDAPSFFTALEEQLGLRLEAVRAPVEVLVIDRLEPPTEN